jgi:hypothetical protein
VNRKSRSRELQQELDWSFGISALRVSGNREGNTLGEKVPKAGKSDRWRTCRQVESNLVDRFRVWRSKGWEPCIWIREISKSEIPMK